MVGAAGQTGENGFRRGKDTAPVVPPATPGHRCAGCWRCQQALCSGVCRAASSQPLPLHRYQTQSYFGFSWIKPLSAVAGASKSFAAPVTASGAAATERGTWLVAQGPSVLPFPWRVEAFLRTRPGNPGGFCQRLFLSRGSRTRCCVWTVLGALLAAAAGVHLVPDGLPEGGTLSAEISWLLSEG